MAEDWDQSRLYVISLLEDVKKNLVEVREKQEASKLELAILKTKVGIWSAIISAVASGAVSIAAAFLKGR
jgi:3-methyladenine DNA glycosylase/8-oxoguanine DNA glycosylase